MKLKAILFDMDNTLIDLLRIKEHALRESASAMVDAGLNMKEESAYRKMWALYNKHGWEDQKIFQKLLREHIGKLDYKILSAGIVAYKRTKTRYVVPYSGVRRTLLKLKKKGIKLGIVSDAPRINVWVRLTETGLVDYFDVILAKEDTGKRKPHTLPFRKGLRMIGFPAEEVLFVGDNPRKDIGGAKQVGMKTCLAKYGQYEKGRKKADFEINKFEELLKVIS